MRNLRALAVCALIYLLVTAIVAVLCFRFLGASYDCWHISEHPVTTTGTITWRGCNGRGNCRIGYEFTANGVRYGGTQWDSTRRYREHDVAMIVYDAESPERSIVGSLDARAAQEYSTLLGFTFAFSTLPSLLLMWLCLSKYKEPLRADWLLSGYRIEKDRCSCAYAPILGVWTLLVLCALSATASAMHVLQLRETAEGSAGGSTGGFCAFVFFLSVFSISFLRLRIDFDSTGVRVRGIFRVSRFGYSEIARLRFVSGARGVETLHAYDRAERRLVTAWSTMDGYSELAARLTEHARSNGAPIKWR